MAQFRAILRNYSHTPLPRAGARAYEGAHTATPDLTPRSSRFPPLDQLLAVLNPIQRKWVYLEPIFGRGAMPHEQARFRRVDDEFRALMSSIVDDPRVFSVLKVPQLVT